MATETRNDKLLEFYSECQRNGYTDMKDKTQSLKAKVIAADLGLNYSKIGALYDEAKKVSEKKKQLDSKEGKLVYGGESRPFSMKIICGKCGAIYGRKSHLQRGVEPYWQCKTRCKKGPVSCKSENIKETVIEQVFLEAWNTMVRQRRELEKHWASLESNGTALQKVKAGQFRELTQQGIATECCPELVQIALERIVVLGDGAFEVRFLDGTKYKVLF